MEIILDTNILIEILKNNKQTIKEVEEYDIHYISVITAMELFYGAFNKMELQKLKKFIELFNIIPPIIHNQLLLLKQNKSCIYYLCLY